MTKVVEQYAVLTYEAFALSIQMSPKKWEDMARKIFMSYRYDVDENFVDQLCYEVGLVYQSSECIRMLRKWYEHQIYLAPSKEELEEMDTRFSGVDEADSFSDIDYWAILDELFEERWSIADCLPPYIRRKR